MAVIVEQLRRACEVAPRNKLAEMASSVWKAFAAGSLAETEAQQLAELIEARKVVSTEIGRLSAPAGTMALARRVGSRPKSAESLVRRRRWIAAGWMPPALACHFTTGELAALALIASEVAKHGRCSLYVDQIAAFAGVARSTVKRATRHAQFLGLIQIEGWKITPIRNGSNRITIISREWSTWLRLRGQRKSGETVQSGTTSPKSSTYLSANRKTEPYRHKGRREDDGRPTIDNPTYLCSPRCEGDYAPHVTNMASAAPGSLLRR